MLSEKDYERGKYLVYAEEVRKLTEKTFRKEFIENSELRGYDWQLDHKVSVRDCYINEIPPGIAAHVCNLQMVPRGYNQHKGSRSSITASELIEEATSFDSFWYADEWD